MNYLTSLEHLKTTIANLESAVAEAELNADRRVGEADAERQAAERERDAALERAAKAEAIVAAVRAAIGTSMTSEAMEYLNRIHRLERDVTGRAAEIDRLNAEIAALKAPAELSVLAKRELISALDSSAPGWVRASDAVKEANNSRGKAEGWEPLTTKQAIDYYAGLVAQYPGLIERGPKGFRATRSIAALDAQGGTDDRLTVVCDDWEAMLARAFAGEPVATMPDTPAPRRKRTGIHHPTGAPLKVFIDGVEYDQQGNRVEPAPAPAEDSKLAAWLLAELEQTPSGIGFQWAAENRPDYRGGLAHSMGQIERVAKALAATNPAITIIDGDIIMLAAAEPAPAPAGDYNAGLGDLAAAIERVTGASASFARQPQPKPVAVPAQGNANDAAIIRALEVAAEDFPGKFIKVGELHRRAEAEGYTLTEAALRFRMKLSANPLAKQRADIIEEQASPLAWRLRDPKPDGGDKIDQPEADEAEPEDYEQIASVSYQEGTPDEYALVLDYFPFFGEYRLRRATPPIAAGGYWETEEAWTGQLADVLNNVSEAEAKAVRAALKAKRAADDAAPVAPEPAPDVPLADRLLAALPEWATGAKGLCLVEVMRAAGVPHGGGNAREVVKTLKANAVFTGTNNANRLWYRNANVEPAPDAEPEPFKLYGRLAPADRLKRDKLLLEALGDEGKTFLQWSSEITRRGGDMGPNSWLWLEAAQQRLKDEYISRNHYGGGATFYAHPSLKEALAKLEASAAKPA